jgi:RHS repeat-associated protein
LQTDVVAHEFPDALLHGEWLGTPPARRSCMTRTLAVTIGFLITAGCGVGKVTVGSPQQGKANTQAVGSPDAGIIVNTTTNQIGRLTRMGNGLYRSLNQYDALGRDTAVQHVMENVSYVYETTFGYANRPPNPPELGNLVATTTFPDGEIVDYSYDVAGGQFSINATPAGAAAACPPNIVTHILRNERGQTTEVDYGNGASQFHCYNDGKMCGGVQQPSTDLRLSQISTSLNGTLQQYTYVFDPNGNVTSVTDINGDATATYCYDSLDRLISGQGPNANWNFGYDDFGNLTSKDGAAQTYLPGTHQLGCVGGSCPTSGLTQSYDANGNMISRSDGLALTWDAENMPVFVAGGAATSSTEKYFLGEELWKKIQGGVVTYLLPSMRLEDGLPRKYFGTFAERSTDGTLKFYQNDHLGSATLVTDANGNVIRRASYQPFGEDRATPIALFSPSTGLRYKFNFKEQEQDGTGLYDYGARLYNPSTGRWLSADTSSVDGLNRYAYVLNNPLRYVDPTGHATDDDPIDPESGLSVSQMQAGMRKDAGKQAEGRGKSEDKKEDKNGAIKDTVRDEVKDLAEKLADKRAEELEALIARARKAHKAVRGYEKELEELKATRAGLAFLKNALDAKQLYDLVVCLKEISDAENTVHITGDYERLYELKLKAAYLALGAAAGLVPFVGAPASIWTDREIEGVEHPEKAQEKDKIDPDEEERAKVRNRALFGSFHP